MLLNNDWISAWLTPMPASQDCSAAQFLLDLVRILRHQGRQLDDPDNGRGEQRDDDQQHGQEDRQRRHRLRSARAGATSPGSDSP